MPHPWLPPVWPAEFILTRGGQQEISSVPSTGVPQHFLAPFAMEISHFSECARLNRAPSVVTETDSFGNARALEILREAVVR